MPDRSNKPGIWGTYRSRLVAGAVLSVLAGVIGLMPLSFINMPAPGSGTLAWVLFLIVTSFPVVCFVAPGIAYLAYRAERRVMTVALLAAPLYLAASVVLIWFALDVACADPACGL